MISGANVWVQLIIAFIAGASLPLAFAPYSFWPLVILSPAILIYQLSYLQRGPTVFWLGWVYGLGYFGLGVNWVYHSLHDYGYAPVALAAALTLLLICYMAVYIGAALWLHQRLRGQLGERALWLLPLLWFSMEWFKGWVMTGFPWLSIGYAHIDSPLAGYAPLIGVYGVGAISILLSLLLVRWLQLRHWLNPLVIVLIGLTGFALQQIDWTRSHDGTLRVTMIQGNIAQEMKWRSSERQRIIDTYWQETRRHWDSDLVVWPEAAIPGRSEDLQPLLKMMAAEARANDSNLLTGILVSNWQQRIYHNSMLLLGNSDGVYHKRHLVPFGEYYPLRSLLDFMREFIKIPMSDMTAGPAHQQLITVNDVKLGVSICYEDVFSRDINLDLPEANILVNTSNDAWFGDSLAPHQHLEIAQMRSLETGRPMIRSTNTGRSAFIDDKGRIISATDQFVLQTLTAELQGRSGATPFITFAVIQPWLAMLILLLTIVVLRRPRSTSGTDVD